VPRARDAIAIGAAGLLWFALAGRWLAAAQWSPVLPVALALAGIGGVLAADLLSGVVHFVCDRFFGTDTPWIGRVFISPFRTHHDDPAAIARHGFCERNGNSCVAVLPLLIAAHAGFDAAPAPLSETAQHAWLLALAAAASATNEIHALAHRERPPGLVRRLQQAGVILSPEAHRQHHIGGHARAYCITTGWCNRVLDAHAAFATVEDRIRRIARILHGMRAR
jgi:plasmanylethanolamine desaturase